MNSEQRRIRDLYQRCVGRSHEESDYFCLVRELVAMREKERPATPARIFLQQQIDRVYALVEDEIRTRTMPPAKPVSFGTSGWRGVLGKEICVFTATAVTAAIAFIYEDLDHDTALTGEARQALAVSGSDEARKRGCLIGYDNRFGGPLLAEAIAHFLSSRGFAVHMAGESTTGVLSAALLEIGAAFSINLTPSHNPLEYGGFKFNAADGGPALPVLTDCITERARRMVQQGLPASGPCRPQLIRSVDALSHWQTFVRKNKESHGIDYDEVVTRLGAARDLFVAVDCIHGASRGLAGRLLGLDGVAENRMLLRGEADPTFGGVAPEPSSDNMQPITRLLASRCEPLKLGAIIDPDGDRIRFTDGRVEISMNHFGAMAYHFLKQHKGKRGPVAKTVATSNFAEAIARKLGEDLFEPAVGFKNFRPVLGRALVCFEESDGMTIIGHTPEKDAFIGLILAIDMVLTLGRNLGEILSGLEESYGAFYPARDGKTVALQGEELLEQLRHLDQYVPGSAIAVGDTQRVVSRLITVDGHKLVLDDGSWIMVRPSGTEPKVRLYVEARSPGARDQLFEAAGRLLRECGL